MPWACPIHSPLSWFAVILAAVLAHGWAWCQEINRVVCMKKRVLMCSAFIFLMAGCGQKGPLYLPQPAKPSPDATQTVPEPGKPESKKDSTQH